MFVYLQEFESKKKENDTPLITEEEDAFGKQVLLSSEIVDSICRVDTSVYPAIVPNISVYIFGYSLRTYI